MHLLICRTTVDSIQINSVGLTKNLLLAINSQSHDMPPLTAFPKSHIVTFKYYLGVIHFLDENYAEVCIRANGRGKLD